MESKVCKKCGESKPLKEMFHNKHSNGKTYYLNYCDRCYKDIQNERRKKAMKDDPQKRLQRNKRAKERRNKDPRIAMLSNSLGRARRKGLDHNITLEDIVIPEKCPILGIPLVNSEGTISQNSPSLDRVDPTKGYVKGNVAVISVKANNMKSNATLGQIKLFITNILPYLDKKGLHNHVG